MSGNGDHGELSAVQYRSSIAHLRFRITQRRSLGFIATPRKPFFANLDSSSFPTHFFVPSFCTFKHLPYATEL
jgi:hypothetical protein